MPDLQILGVAEVAINATDLESAKAFYCNVLGFRLVSEASHENGMEPEAGRPPTICFLEIAPSETPLGRHGHPPFLVLIDPNRHHFARPAFESPVPRRSTLNHLAFEVDPERLEPVRDALRASGLDVRETRFAALQARALFFEDPEGNTLEIICYDPDSAP